MRKTILGAQKVYLEDYQGYETSRAAENYLGCLNKMN